MAHDYSEDTYAFHRYPDLVGDGTGAKSMNVDGSVTPQQFILQPRLDATSTLGSDDEHKLEIWRAIIFIECTGTPLADNFGDLAKLTNGVTVGRHDAGGVLLEDYTDGLPFKSNGQLARACVNTNILQVGAGSNFVTAEWILGVDGHPLLIDDMETMRVTVQDNLSTLLDFTIMFQGIASK